MSPARVCGLAPELPSAPTSDAQDLGYARKLINDAKDGILFLFFNPGTFVSADQPRKWTLLQNILVRHHNDSPNYNPALYMRGVVNQEIANLTTESTDGPRKHAILDPSAPANPVTLFSGGNLPPQRLTHESMVPQNIKSTFHNWATEVLGSGVHIHSKVIVLDPFGENPVVMTGSHNLGYKASSKNDDNLMIIEGNAPLAAAFAVNIIAIYQSYRWNARVEAHRQDPQMWHGLVGSDAWQSSYLEGEELAEIEFWLGEHPAATDKPANATAPGGLTAHTTSAGSSPGGTARPRQGPTGKKAPARPKAPTREKTLAKPRVKARAAMAKKAPVKHRPARRGTARP